MIVASTSFFMISVTACVVLLSREFTRRNSRIERAGEAEEESIRKILDFDLPTPKRQKKQ
jgi:hypothetical protein